MEQLILAIKFTVQENDQEKFRNELLQLFKQIEKEENFVSAKLNQNKQNPNEFLVYEIWTDTIEHFLQVQLKKDYALAWDRMLADMKITREPNIYTLVGEFSSN